MPVEEPDEVQELPVDRGTLPPGRSYREAGFEWRQVIDLDISSFVTEYRAQILEDDRGERHVAAFPEGVTRPDESTRWRERYRALLAQAEQESPPPDAGKRTGTPGRVKRSKARNLLERLRDFEDDALRFMENPIIPFTNNQGENDLRRPGSSNRFPAASARWRGPRCSAGFAAISPPAASRG
jgi:hypothetical protein